MIASFCFSIRQTVDTPKVHLSPSFQLNSRLRRRRLSLTTFSVFSTICINNAPTHTRADLVNKQYYIEASNGEPSEVRSFVRICQSQRRSRSHTKMELRSIGTLKTLKSWEFGAMSRITTRPYVYSRRKILLKFYCNKMEKLKTENRKLKTGIA